MLVDAVRPIRSKNALVFIVTLTLVVLSAACGTGSPVAPDAASPPANSSAASATSAIVTGTIYASIADAEPPVADATIEVVDAAGETHVAHSGADGSYRVSVRAGDVTMTATKDGFHSNEQRFTVREDTVLNFSLNPL